MQVIWAIGASMVVLAGAQWLGRRTCFAIGAAILLGHNLLDASGRRTVRSTSSWPLWVALHAQMAHRAGPFLFLFIYPLLPWIGVMLLGFGAAGVFEWPPDRRNASCCAGLGLITDGRFVVLRALDIYGDPNPWQLQPGGMTSDRSSTSSTPRSTRPASSSC